MASFYLLDKITTKAQKTTGTLKLTPLPDQSGSAEVVVTIEDGGLDGDLSTSGDNASFARTIVVQVTPVNDVPTLDVVGSLNIDEDSAEQILDLTNASAGGGDAHDRSDSAPRIAASSSCSHPWRLLAPPCA